MLIYSEPPRYEWRQRRGGFPSNALATTLMGDNSHLKHKNTAWNMYDIDENGHIARDIYPKWFHLMCIFALLVGFTVLFRGPLNYSNE